MGWMDWRIAFEEPRCGDCVISLLLGLSGEKGLNAFLPDGDAGRKVYEGGEVLSRVKIWKEAGYAVDAGRSMARSIGLIQRYSYMIGSFDLYLQT